MANPRRAAADTLPRKPKRRTSGSVEPEFTAVEELLQALPDANVERSVNNNNNKSATTTRTDSDELYSLIESHTSESTVGRWSSSSSLDYYATAEDDSDELNASRLRRRVHFCTVQVREYAVCEGDHPHCEMPLSLDWQHSETEIKHVDAYQSFRSFDRSQNSATSSQSEQEPRLPRKLSLWERQERIQSFLDDSEEEEP